MKRKKYREWKEKWLASGEGGKPLKPRERAFCRHYVDCYDPALAALRAGFPKEKAEEAGASLLANRAAIAEIMGLRDARGLALSLCQPDIVERYMAIAFADVTDFVDFGWEKAEAAGKEPKMANYIRLKPSSLVNGAIVSQIAVDGDKVSVKLEDRMKALEWLTGYFKMNPLEKQKLKFERKKMEMGDDGKNRKMQIEIRRKEDGGEGADCEFDGN